MYLPLGPGGGGRQCNQPQIISHQVCESHMGALQGEVHPRQPAAGAKLQHPLALQLPPRVEVRVALHVPHQDHARVPDGRAEIVRRWVLGRAQKTHTRRSSTYVFIQEVGTMIRVFYGLGSTASTNSHQAYSKDEC